MCKPQDKLFPAVKVYSLAAAKVYSLAAAKVHSLAAATVHSASCIMDQVWPYALQHLASSAGSGPRQCQSPGRVRAPW